MYLPLLFLVLIPTSLGHITADYARKSNSRIGPKGMPYNKTTSCKTFSKNARFNPHAAVGERWFVFYFWAPHNELREYEFTIPSRRDMKYLYNRFEGHVPPSFNWSNTMVFLKEMRTNRTRILVEKDDRGRYWSYPIYKTIPKGAMVDHLDIRLKQTSDNKYIGMLECDDRMAYVMSRRSKVPPQNLLQEEASKLGYRGRKGKSYLYRGHEWMPIPEQDENDFWRRKKTMKQKFSWDT